MSLARTLEAGADALDDVLEAVFGVAKAKNKIDPLHPKGFRRLIRSIARELADEVGPIDDAAVERAIGELTGVNWSRVTPEQRAQIVASAARWIRATGPVAAPNVDRVLRARATEITQATRAAAVDKFNLRIEPKIGQGNDPAARIAGASQAHYVRDAAKVRSESFAARARAIVESGIQAGLGQKAIVEDLRRELEPAGRSDAYLAMIANVFATRARAAAQVFAFSEAGIERYRWSSVLDGATSNVCRMLHGRVFETAGAVGDLHRAEEAEDPEAIVEISPFLSESKGAIWVGRGENRILVANVVESAIGHEGKIGRYDLKMSHEALEAAGVRFPPAHGHCRSTIVPDE